MGENLPPGVTDNMIPGNRPEDVEWEKFEEWALKKFVDSAFDIHEARRAVLIGIAGVKAEQLLVDNYNKDAFEEGKREGQLMSVAKE